MSYLGHSLGESYLSAEMQPVYSTVPGDWATALIKQQEGIYRNERNSYM